MTITAGLRNAEASERFFPGEVPDRFRIRLGSVLGSFDTNFSYSPVRGGLSGLINFEDLLGVESSKTSFRLSGNWRFGKRSRLEFSYGQFERSGSEGPQWEFQFLGFTILAGTAVDSDFDSKVAAVAYRYDAYDNGEVRLYGSAGLSYFDLNARLATGIGVIKPNGEPLGRALERQIAVSQAIPMIGVGADWAVSRRFMTNLFIRGLFLDISGFRGGITEVGLRGTWFFHRNLGVGGGFQRTDIRLREYRGSDYTVRGAYSQLGVLLYLEAAF